MTPESAAQIYSQRKDPAAFTVLVEAYQGLVYSVCRRVLPAAEVDDAVQNVFVKLSTGVANVHGNLPSWLYSCALNTSRDVLRRNRARQERETKYATHMTSVRNESQAEVPLAEVDRAMLDLADEDRRLVVRYYLDGETQQQIADDLQLSQSTVKRKTDRAIGRLRERLKGRGITTAVTAIAVAIQNEAAAADVPAALTDRLNQIGLSGTSAAAGTGGAAVAQSATASFTVKAGVAATVAVGIVGVIASTETEPNAAAIAGAAVAAENGLPAGAVPTMSIKDIGPQVFYIEERDLAGVDFNTLVNEVIQNHRRTGQTRVGPVTYIQPDGFRGQPEVRLLIAIPTDAVLPEGETAQGNVVLIESYRCASLSFEQSVPPDAAVEMLTGLVEESGLKRTFIDRWVPDRLLDGTPNFTVQFGIE